MGGTIQVTSDGVSGSKFSFSIPFKYPTTEKIQESVNNLTPPPEIKRRDSSAFVKQLTQHQKLLVAEVTKVLRVT